MVNQSLIILIFLINIWSFTQSKSITEIRNEQVSACIDICLECFPYQTSENVFNINKLCFFLKINL